ncbi:MAG: glycoside hydrolase family 9 protein [Marinilabiliaceae bacterium]|nr:glycoside hydrolase family 9 protein [Marinilabiliaceae bacterium]
MKKYFTCKCWPILALIVTTACNPKPVKININYTDKILLNQVGYITNMPKTAFSKSKTSSFFIVDNNNNKLYSNKTDSGKTWSFSGDTLYKLDFTAFNTPGIFRLVINDSIASYPFEISNKPYNILNTEAIRSYYINRSGIDIKANFAGKWARKAGHPDTAVIIHESAASKLRPEGTIVSSPGGWYDAGDYNKYVVNSSISTYTLLEALNDFQPYFKNAKLNIPESNNELPDFLDEILYNLNWVITMQDPNDGGVYHKLTTKSFESFVMPHQAVNKRYLIQKTTSATLDYAALLASASRILKPYNNHLGSLIDSCKVKAEKAWNWALANPQISYKQPTDIRTGTYGDSLLVDEWYWAASELFLATNNNTYINFINKYHSRYNVPTWDNTGMLGTISLLDNFSKLPESINKNNLKRNFFHIVDSLVDVCNTSSFQIGLGHFAWGSNSDVANQGFLKLKAFQLTKKIKYFQSALNDADYLLGRNATGYCFVTGFGSTPPMNIHHRPSGADTVKAPVPGFLVGGPNLIVPTDCGNNIYRNPFPAKAYSDLKCSYSTNEIAINWNAPLVYLMSGLSNNE